MDTILPAINKFAKKFETLKTDSAKWEDLISSCEELLHRFNKGNVLVVYNDYLGPLKFCVLDSSWMKFNDIYVNNGVSDEQLKGLTEEEQEAKVKAHNELTTELVHLLFDEEGSFKLPFTYEIPKKTFSHICFCGFCP